MWETEERQLFQRATGSKPGGIGEVATAQVVFATTALHDEKIEDQLIMKPEDDIKNTDDQETTVTTPQEEDQLAKEPADTVAPQAESEALAVEAETKLVLNDEDKEEEGKVSPVEQPAKVAPEPEPEAEETKEPEAKSDETKKEIETEPDEAEKVDTEPEEKVKKKEEAVAAEE
ncbi:unnamed protein product [Lactuca virosa]|uniref:Uncharacterized protein n=1 Tax=Lactuca virosa TaxID=75947 RepID=A0AAU9P3W0_9ASTR|nr:unnamed protein product [Lactuca virosa]